MQSMIRLTLRPVVFLLFLLSACFSSDNPLLTEEDAVTPLPDTFTLVELDASGKIKTDEKGHANVSEFTRNGKTYLHQDGLVRFTLTAAELVHNLSVFLVQDVMSTQDPQKGEVHLVTYYLALIQDNMVVKYLPPEPGKTGLDLALKNAGVVYTTDGDKFVFSDKMHLLAAARVYASHAVDGKITPYRIASSKQEIAALRQEIAAGPSKEAPRKGASAGAQADGSAQQECDALAASPSDLSRPAGVPGVQFDKIYAQRAEAACRRAVQEHPSPRFYYQLGRALDAGHKYADAVANYRVAADQEHAPAQQRLGYLYYKGDEVREDAAQAVYWLRKAAAQGYAPAQNSLGVAYNAGKGVEYDDDKAIYWFRKAAAQGNEDAQENLDTLEQFYRTHGGGNGVAAERQRQDSERRLRCDTAHLFGDPMARAMPGCY